VEVRDITREVQRRDLPHTMGVPIEPTHVTRYHQIGELGLLTEFDEIPVGPDLLCVPAQIENSLLLFASEYRSASKSLQEVFEVGSAGLGH
jgi:hypothetical protein